MTGSRASETGSELSQSHSVSSLDPDDEERLRQVRMQSLSIAQKHVLNDFSHFLPNQDFDVFAAQQTDNPVGAVATPEPTSQTGLAAAAALVHGHAPTSPTPTTPTPPAGNADLAQPDTVAAQTVALIHAEQQPPQTQQVATIGQEKSTQEKVRDLDAGQAHSRFSILTWFLFVLDSRLGTGNCTSCRCFYHRAAEIALRASWAGQDTKDNDGCYIEAYARYESYHTHNAFGSITDCCCRHSNGSGVSDR